MPISKIKTSSITADAASVNLNIDANTLFMDVANNRVGIGNTSPVTNLAIGSGAGAGSYGGGVYLNRGASAYNFYEASDGTNSVIFGLDNNVSYAKIGSVSSTAIALHTSNAARLYITAGGDVGIGTSSPSYKLDVAVTAANNAGMRLYNSSAGAGNGCGISFSIANAFSSLNQHAAIQALSETSGNTLTSLAFYTSGGSNAGNATERMRIDSSGNLGLGVTPSAWDATYKTVQVNYANYAGNTTSANITHNAYYNAGWKYIASSTSSTIYDQFQGAHRWFNAASGTAGNAISFAQAMTLDASGNLGIGTNLPGYKLDVASGDTTAGQAIRIRANSTAGAGGLQFTDSVASSQYGWIKGKTTGLSFYSGNNTAGDMFLDSSGNLAVGGTQPAKAVIDIQNNSVGSVVDTTLHLGYSGGPFYGSRIVNSNNPAATSAGLFKIQQGTTTAWRDDLVIDNIGNVGIGTTAAYGGRLNIVPSSTPTTAAGANALQIGESSSNTAYRLQMGYFNDPTNGFVSSIQSYAGGSPNNLVLQGAGGNLLVGTTSTLRSGDKFSVSGSGSQVATFRNNTNTSGYSAISTVIQANANNTSSYHLWGNTDAVGNWYLYGNGTTSFSSDVRLKKNVVTARNGYIDDICKLRVVKYNWKKDADGTPKELGLIAQEVEQVFPALVQDDLNPIEEGGEIYKQVKQSVLPFILLKAIQEQQALIQSLTTRISVLETK